MRADDGRMDVLLLMAVRCIMVDTVHGMSAWSWGA
jgi:hypothetical protein